MALNIFNDEKETLEATIAYSHNKVTEFHETIRKMLLVRPIKVFFSRSTTTSVLQHYSLLVSEAVLQPGPLSLFAVCTNTCS